MSLALWYGVWMLRILLWRLIFEGLNLLKLLGWRGKQVHYFAYGANLDSAVMAQRHMFVLNAEPVVLKDWVLDFNHEIPFQGAAMASITAHPGGTVQGMLYTLYRIDALRMDCMEACLIFKRYRKNHFTLQQKTCFFYTTGRPLAGLKPSKEYLGKIVNGYKKLLGDNHPTVQTLKQQETVSDWVPKHPPRFLILNYSRWGEWLRPCLETYDALCMRLFVFFIFRPSVFARCLKT